MQLGFTYVTIIACPHSGYGAHHKWIGERITEHERGNGIPLLNFISIISHVPNMLQNIGGRSGIPETSSVGEVIVANPYVCRNRYHVWTLGTQDFPVRKKHCRQEDVRRTVHPHPDEGQPNRRYAFDFSR